MHTVFSKHDLRLCACVHAFVRWHNTDTCSPSKVRLLCAVSWQWRKTWLTTFVGTINAEVIFFFYGRTGVFEFKFLLSDVNRSHNTTWSHHVNHRQRGWHNDHLSVVQYSASKTLGPGVNVASPGWRTYEPWHKLKGWIRPSNPAVKQIWFTMRPQRVL